METDPPAVDLRWVVSTQAEFDQTANDFNRIGSQGGGWSGEYNDANAIAANGLASLRSANPGFAAEYDAAEALRVAALPDPGEASHALGTLASMM